MRNLVYSLLGAAAIGGSVVLVNRHQDYVPVKEKMNYKAEVSEKTDIEKEAEKRTGLFSDKRLEPLVANQIFLTNRVIRSIPGKSEDTQGMELIGILGQGEKRFAMISLPVEVNRKKVNPNAMPKDIENQLKMMPEHFRNSIKETWQNNPEMRSQIEQRIRNFANHMDRGGGMRNNNAQNTPPEENAEYEEEQNGKVELRQMTRIVSEGDVLDNEFEVLEIGDEMVSVRKGSQTINLAINATDKTTLQRNADAVKSRGKAQTAEAPKNPPQNQQRRFPQDRNSSRRGGGGGGGGRNMPNFNGPPGGRR